jgi:hypothetical protein
LTYKIKEEFFMKTITEITAIIESTNPRSAWSNGVKAYSLELLNSLPLDRYDSLEAMYADALNGAKDWSQYSWGGCSLIYDAAIARRLCTPSELKKTRNGERRPNSNEEWLDTQARALNQAFRNIRQVYCGNKPMF